MSWVLGNRAARAYAFDSDSFVLSVHGLLREQDFEPEYQCMIGSKNLELDFFLEITNSGKRRERVRGGKFVSCAWNTNIFYNLDDGVIFKPVKKMGKGIDLYLIENKHIKNPNKNAAIYKQYLIDWIRSHTTQIT